MAIVLFDSNILIDNFNGHTAAALEILPTTTPLSVPSFGWKLPASWTMLKGPRLTRCSTQPKSVSYIRMTASCAWPRQYAAIAGRPPRRHRAQIGLPDCIIRATAEVEGRLIVTRNPGDFGGGSVNVRVPYDIVDGVA
jgi:hypothetical protein